MMEIIENEKKITKDLTIVIDQSYYNFSRTYLLREVSIETYDY